MANFLSLFAWIATLSLVKTGPLIAPGAVQSRSLQELAAAR